ncbi:restriction endonuclease subunit S [Lactobacillus amylovorus]|uniref:restriction endonuclease subunit S n=1 Tax=Lactobacillus amylovorus TaxID=1604 RepID=UPI003F9AF9F0
MQNMKINDKNQEWIGNIPKNWTFKKIKYVLAQRNEKNIPIKSKDILSLTAKQGVIPYTEKEGGGNKPKTDFSAYKLAYPGDIVMNSMNILSGAVGLSKYFGCVSPVYYMLYCSNDEDDIRYFYYVFANKAFQSSLLGIGNGILMKESENGTFNTIRMRIPIEKLNNMSIPYPKPEIQKAIANFLDKKIGKIDEVSKKIQQEITDLEAYRKSVITKTITKGLNPNVPMKDSGIEWIGKIPTDWSVIRLKYLGSAGNGLTYSPQNMTDESGTLILRSSNIQHGEIVNADNVYVNSSVSKSLILKKDDLLICSRNGSKDLIGKNALINKEFIGSSFGAFMCVFRSKYNQYIYYVLNSNIFKFYVGSFLTSTINQLTKHNLYNLAFPFPQKENERKQIIAFLKEKCENINHLITHKKDQLKLLNQYKQSIIYEYVTGKKQVPTEEGAKE